MYVPSYQGFMVVPEKHEVTKQQAAREAVGGIA